MKIPFFKYQATGNDFVLIDNRLIQHSFSKEEVEKICHRKFGIGADGLILLENDPTLDFKMVYFNSDGSQSLCGNGCRSAVHLASYVGLVNGNAVFNAYDGAHKAEILPAGIVRLQMNDVEGVKSLQTDYFVDTGSPHYVRFVKDLQQYPVFDEGRTIRNSKEFKEKGVNANFVELLPGNQIFVRTYERGVENETLSCGTGVTAAALVAALKGYTSPISVKTLGGDLSVEFKSGQSGLPNRQADTFHDVFLIGPAKMVFTGEMEL